MRFFLLVVVGLAFLSTPIPAGSNVSTPSTTRLRLFHTHTGEHIDVVYREGDHYIPEALEKLDHFLRDHRTGEVHHFNPKLFDVVSAVAASLGKADAEIHIICGYRTPWSNNYLRTHTSGVAKNSLHMLAEAMDVRLPGIRTSVFRDAALSLHLGGVGFYPESDFVHIDIGRVRRW